MIETIQFEAKSSVTTLAGTRIVSNESLRYIVIPLTSAIQEIGAALKPMYNLSSHEEAILTFPEDSNKTRYIGQKVISKDRPSIEQQNWIKYFRKNQVDESLLVRLKQLLFFRFVTGYAITEDAIQVFKLGKQIILHSAHEARLDPRIHKVSGEYVRDDFKQEGTNWEVFGKSKESLLCDDYSPNKFFISIDGQVEMRRILGSLRRSALEKWLDKVKEIICSIDPKYASMLVQEMREKITSVVEFNDHDEQQRRKYEDLPILSAALDKWKREGRSSPEIPPAMGMPIVVSSQWQSLSDYPKWELHASGKIRLRKSKENVKISVYDKFPFVLENRTTKVRADKLIYKAFSNYKGELGALRITTLDGDASNIAFSNLVQSSNKRCEIRKPRKVYVNGEVYESINKAAKATNLKISKLRSFIISDDE